MTEAEWNACADPQPMLEFLQGKASDRKLRLFAVACCRRIWHLLSDERSRRAVEVAEDFADGLARDEELQTAFTSAGDVPCDPTPALTTPLSEHTDSARMVFAGFCASSTASYAARNTAARHILPYNLLRRAAEAMAYGAFDVSDPAFTASDLAEDVERIGQAAVVREIFGNPFRPVTLDPIWLTSIVQNLAAIIYDERAFDRLPILADALEDCGCTNADILNHCRQPGEHVRGCWVIDLLLAKE